MIMKILTGSADSFLTIEGGGEFRYDMPIGFNNRMLSYSVVFF